MKNNEHNDRNHISELLFAIMNIAHAEYHMVDQLMINVGVNDIESFKKKLVDVRLIRIRLMKKLQDEFPAVKGVWCTFKHLLLTEFHLFEIYEKTLDDHYLEESRRIHMMIDDLLVTEELASYIECPRCDEDVIDDNNNIISSEPTATDIEEVIRRR